MPTSHLLSLLADGEFHSGEVLARRLGVSRTAVWKRLNKLAAAAGLQVESVRGKGYRIPGGLDLLDAGRLRAALRPDTAALLAGVQVFEQIDSTNAELLRQLAAADPLSGLVCVAEQQTAGRGRLGRHWVSPYASNIYLSLLWRFAQGATALEGLSLAVGVAVAHALRRSGVDGVQLKWPNDVLHGGAKLGGILLEMVGDTAGPCAVVIGVGLNVRMPGAAAGDIDQPWTDLEHALPGVVLSRTALLAALLDTLLPLLHAFEAEGFARWRSDWLALDAYAGAPVVLATGAAQVMGIARGVDERGALQLETATGLQHIYGGEMSLRPAG